MRTELIQKAYDLGNKIEAALEKEVEYQMSDVDELMEVVEQLDNNEIDVLLGIRLGNTFLIMLDNREFHQN